MFVIEKFEEFCDDITAKTQRTRIGNDKPTVYARYKNK